MGVEEFAVKVTVVLVRSTSVAEVVGWCPQELWGRTKQVKCLLRAHICT